jgi:aspartyl protease family protein
MDGDDFGRLAYLLLLLAALGGWMIIEFRQRMGQTLRAAAAWGLIFIGVMAGYGLWQDVKTDITPFQTVTDQGTVELPRAEDGHYYPTLLVNGTEVRFVADTGATNIVLSKEDARRLGFDPESLMFTGEAMTANGPVRTARVTLEQIRFGPFRDQGLSAFVNDGEMDGSLLGMDYLGLFRVEISDNRMILSR